MINDRNINIITDADNQKIVLINDIVFKGKRNVDWESVKSIWQAMWEIFIK